MTANRKKVELDKAVRELVDIAEQHLAQFPDDEMDARVKAFARRNFTKAASGS